MRTKNIWLWGAVILCIIVLVFAHQWYFKSAYAETITKQEATDKVLQQYPGQVLEIQVADETYLILLEMETGLYEIHLDAANGDILALERTLERQPNDGDINQNRQPQQNDRQEDDSSPAMLNQDEISAIALQQAEGHLTSLQPIQDSKGLHVHQAVIEAPRERTIVIIHSVSGDVLSTSKEVIKKPVTSAEEAASIALQYVGGGHLDDVERKTKNDLTYYEVEIEFDDDREVYVHINAETGEIIFVEWDD